MAKDIVNVTLNLSAQDVIRNTESGKLVLDWSKVPVDTIAEILQGGARIILTNAFNGGGKDIPEAERLSQAQKRIDSWYKGEYRVATRGDSWTSLMREAYIAEQMAAHNVAEKVIADSMKKLVQDTFGEKEKATFGMFLKALATKAAKRDGETRSAVELEAALESKYEKAATELSAARAKASKAIDLTDLGI